MQKKQEKRDHYAKKEKKREKEKGQLGRGVVKKGGQCNRARQGGPDRKTGRVFWETSIPGNTREMGRRPITGQTEITSGALGGQLNA